MAISNAENQRRIRAKRKELGLCGKCGKTPEPGRTSCRACLDRACGQMKAYHARKKATDAAYRERRKELSRESGKKARADPAKRAKMWAKSRECMRARRDMIQAIKLERGCKDCGYKAHAEALDFDHTCPQEKKAAVSRIKTLSLEKLRSEMAKCEVVCANCHRVRTYRRRTAIVD